MLMRITDDLTHAGQSCQFFRSALRIASGDDDPAAGILPMDTANSRPHVLVCGGGHGAGIKDDDSCLRRPTSPVQSQFLELPFDRGPVGLRSPAAEVLHVEAFHVLNSNRESGLYLWEDQSRKQLVSGKPSSGTSFAEQTHPGTDRREDNLPRRLLVMRRSQASRPNLAGIKLWPLAVSAGNIPGRKPDAPASA